MPYILKTIGYCENKKAYEFLISLGFSLNSSQRIIDKKRLFCNKKLIEFKNQIINGEISIIDYKPNPKGLKPIFETEEFAVFDKPSGVLTHPNGRNCKYSMSDEIIYLFGKKACVVHRLDKETSGILIVAKDQESAKEFKKIFENRLIYKYYYALVENNFNNSLIIDEKIAKSIDGEVKIQMQISPNGKEAITYAYPVEYYPNINASLIKLIPKTGRQHQLRVHMFHVKHRILGDPMYGLNTNTIEAIMDNNLSIDERIKHTKAKRLCLHSAFVSFSFRGKKFEIQTKMNYKNEFLNSLMN